MEWNSVKNVFFIDIHVFFFVLEWLGTSFQGIFLLFNCSELNSEYFALLHNGLERNSEHFYLLWNASERKFEVLSFFLFYEMVRNEIPSIFIICGKARNRIPSIFRFAKQVEFQRNESKFPSVPMFREIIFFRRMATLLSRRAGSKLILTFHIYQYILAFYDCIFCHIVWFSFIYGTSESQFSFHQTLF